jgi:hypothetical protein
MQRRHFLVLSAASIGGVLVYSLDRKPFRLAADDRTISIPLRGPPKESPNSFLMTRGRAKPLDSGAEVANHFET